MFVYIGAGREWEFRPSQKEILQWPQSMPWNSRNLYICDVFFTCLTEKASKLGRGNIQMYWFLNNFQLELFELSCPFYTLVNLRADWVTNHLNIQTYVSPNVIECWIFKYSDPNLDSFFSNLSKFQFLPIPESFY